MKKTLILLAATSFLGSALIQAQDCDDIASSVAAAASADNANILEIVDEKVSQNPNCVCEIVKAAISASEAEGKAFGDIVEAAGNAAPDKLQLIVDCSSTVASKSDLPFIEAAATAVQNNNPAGINPLNFPGVGPVGPAAGTDGGNSIINPDSPLTAPPGGVDVVPNPVIPAPVTPPSP